jgi:ATP-dependent DNA helicase PIF1
MRAAMISGESPLFQQVIFIGDFLQIPPVLKTNATERYAFESDAWKTGDISVVHLTQNLRQKDEVFQKILHEVRFDKVTPESLEVLQSRVVPDIYALKANDQGIRPTVLMSINADVDRYNAERLKEISDQEEVVFKGRGMIMSKNHPTAQSDLEFLANNCPAPQLLQLKVGAQVMLRKNIKPDEKLVNGNVGIVVKIDTAENAVYVKFNNRPYQDHVARITSFSWEHHDFLGILTAVYMQIPLCLAWAISIHKSQGQQFSSVAVDMGKIFETGQAYTALSRAESLEGLYLSNFSPLKIKACPVALKFYEELELDESNKKQRI